MRTRIMGLAVAAALAIGMLGAPASAWPYNPCEGQSLRHHSCPTPPPEPDCRTTAILRIDQHRPRDTQDVTVVATNTGGPAVQLVVTYQVNRMFANPQTIIAVDVDYGETFTATFAVPRYRHVDGLVRAFIEDNGCDHLDETVALS